MRFGLSLEEPEALTNSSTSARRRAKREMLREARGKLRPGVGPWAGRAKVKVSTRKLEEVGRLLLETFSPRPRPATPPHPTAAFPGHNHQPLLTQGQEDTCLVSPGKGRAGKG